MDANEMLEMVRGSLEGWPNAGGDIGIAKAVQKIEYRVQIAETKLWRTHFHEIDCVDGIHNGHGGPEESCNYCAEFNNRITLLENAQSNL